MLSIKTKRTPQQSAIVDGTVICPSSSLHVLVVTETNNVDLRSRGGEEQQLMHIIRINLKRQGKLIVMICPPRHDPNSGGEREEIPSRKL